MSMVRYLEIKHDVSVRITERSPGLSWQMILRIRKLPEVRRQYISDTGSLNASRVSVYVSPENALTFALIDAAGECYSVVVPLGEHGISVEQFIYLGFEIGTGSHTFMRILSGGKEIARNDIPFRVDPGPLDMTDGIIGADISGQKGGAFDLVAIWGYNSTLTSDDFDTLTSRLDKPVTVFVRFNGNQWMRREHDKNLRQDDPVHAPTYQTIPPSN